MKILVLLGNDFDKAVLFAKERGLIDENKIAKPAIYLATQEEFPKQIIECENEEEYRFENQAIYDVMQEFTLRRDFNYMDSFIQGYCRTSKNEEIKINTESEEIEYKVESIKFYPAFGICEINALSMKDRQELI